MRSTSTKYLLITLCIVTLASVPALWGDPPDRVGRLNLINGTVSFHPESVEEWAPASLNYPMTIGDHLWTDQDGQAEVHVGSTAIRLASNTEISFLNLNDQTMQIRLSTGSLNLRLRHLGSTEEIEVDTPNASLTLLRAGTYRIDVQQSGDTSVTVRTGEVETTAGSEVFAVRPRQTAEVTGLDSPSYNVTTAPPLDDWDRWCQARDVKEDQVASAQYVPRDEMSGVEDLDQYGRWSNDPDFGPVWTPTVIVVGWAPYHFGHWAWIDPWGWTWIDDAPWGFAPFHYGRWAFRSNSWRWVPGPRTTGRAVYAPALVTFVGGGGWRSSHSPGDSVGWFPLGPHEPFIPPYRTDHGRPRGADVEHIPYANRSVPGAVTFVPNETFVRGQPAGGAALRLPADEVMRAPVRGAFAPLAPQKESFLGGYSPSYASVPRPPAFVTSRPVMARLTPPPQAVPFAVRQHEMASHPGQPLDPETLSSMRQSAPPARSSVNVVNPGYLRRGGGQQSFSQPGGNEPRQPGVQQGDRRQPSRDLQQPRRQFRRDPWQPPEPAGDARTQRDYPRRPQQPGLDPRESAGDVRTPRESPRQPQQPGGEIGTPREYPRQQRDVPLRPQQSPSRQFQQPAEQPQQPAGQVRQPGPASRQPGGQQRPMPGGSRQKILDDQDSGQ